MSVYACQSIVCLHLSLVLVSAHTALVTDEEKTKVFSIIICAAANHGFDASLLCDEYCSVSRGQNAFLHTGAVLGRVFCLRPMQAGAERSLTVRGENFSLCSTVYGFRMVRHG